MEFCLWSSVLYLNKIMYKPTSGAQLLSSEIASDTRVRKPTHAEQCFVSQSKYTVIELHKEMSLQ